MRRCPNCKKYLSIWTLVGPGFYDPGHRGESVCSSCDHIVSKVWDDIGFWYIPIDIALAVGLWQFDFPFSQFMQGVIGILVGTLMLVYFFAPLKNYGKNRRGKRI